MQRSVPTPTLDGDRLVRAGWKASWRLITACQLTALLLYPGPCCRAAAQSPAFSLVIRYNQRGVGRSSGW